MTLQDTLTFDTLDPEELLKRAIKSEHSKLTTMIFQKTNAAATVGTGNNYNSGMRRKQEQVMAVGNSTGNTKINNKRGKRRNEKITTETPIVKQIYIIDAEEHLTRDI